MPTVLGSASRRQLQVSLALRQVLARSHRAGKFCLSGCHCGVARLIHRQSPSLAANRTPQQIAQQLTYNWTANAHRQHALSPRPRREVQTRRWPCWHSHTCHHMASVVLDNPCSRLCSPNHLRCRSPPAALAYYQCCLPAHSRLGTDDPVVGIASRQVGVPVVPLRRSAAECSPGSSFCRWILSVRVWGWVVRRITCQVPYAGTLSAANRLPLPSSGRWSLSSTAVQRHRLSRLAQAVRFVLRA